MNKDDPKYPYEYSCDFIRSLASDIKLSRSDASQIRSGIASVLEINDKKLAKKLADIELRKTNKDYKEHSKHFIDLLGLDN